MSELLKSPSRRLLLLGAIVAAGVLVYALATRRDARSNEFVRGNVALCANQQGDAARDCYTREISRQLAAVGGGSAPTLALAAPAGSDEVTFTSTTSAGATSGVELLCDLHTRVGVTDAAVPSWVGWTEPQVAAVS